MTRWQFCCAAEFSTLNIFELLLELYPESFDKVDGESSNLQHRALGDARQDKVSVNPKIQFLCDRCPAFLQMRNIDGFTPLDNHMKLDLTI